VRRLSSVVKIVCRGTELEKRLEQICTARRQRHSVAPEPIRSFTDIRWEFCGSFADSFSLDERRQADRPKFPLTSFLRRGNSTYVAFLKICYDLV
jgi:hypothetical protein